jgi:hypothetical protein
VRGAYPPFLGLSRSLFSLRLTAENPKRKRAEIFYHAYSGMFRRTLQTPDKFVELLMAYENDLKRRLLDRFVQMEKIVTEV